MNKKENYLAKIIIVPLKRRSTLCIMISICVFASLLGYSLGHDGILSANFRGENLIETL